MRFSPIRIVLQYQTAPIAGARNILNYSGDSLRAWRPINKERHIDRVRHVLSQCRKTAERRQTRLRAFDIAARQGDARTITFTETSITEED